MNGREKIEAALSREGTPEIPAVICYEGIYIRDHWRQLTTAPWWHQFHPDVKIQLSWRLEMVEKIGQDWFDLPACLPRADRQNLEIHQQGKRVFLARANTLLRELHESPVGGWSTDHQLESVHPDYIPRSPEEIDLLVPLAGSLDVANFRAGGQADLAKLLLQATGQTHFPIASVSSPLWLCYYLWGYEDMMAMIASQPDLVRYASQRFLTHALYGVEQAAFLGARGIWIEESLTDQISPRAFRQLNLPLVQAVVEEIRSRGMFSIYYYCGDPRDRLDLLVQSGADALALEESKKNFHIDIAEVAEFVQGKCALLGNLDALWLLPHAGPDELRAEITRQVKAGRRNGSRFIMSIGSPVTPGTSPERVRQYCEMVQQVSPETH